MRNYEIYSDGTATIDDTYLEVRTKTGEHGKPLYIPSDRRMGLEYKDLGIDVRHIWHKPSELIRVMRDAALAEGYSVAEIVD